MLHLPFLNPVEYDSLSVIPIHTCDLSAGKNIYKNVTDVNFKLKFPA